MLRPTIPAELIIVLYRIVSSFDQPYFASKIAVVYPLPTTAKAHYHVPKPNPIARSQRYPRLTLRWSDTSILSLDCFLRILSGGNSSDSYFSIPLWILTGLTSEF